MSKSPSTGFVYLPAFKRPAPERDTDFLSLSESAFNGETKKGRRTPDKWPLNTVKGTGRIIAEFGLNDPLNPLFRFQFPGSDTRFFNCQMDGWIGYWISHDHRSSTDALLTAYYDYAKLILSREFLSDQPTNFPGMTLLQWVDVSGWGNPAYDWQPVIHMFNHHHAGTNYDLEILTGSGTGIYRDTSEGRLFAEHGYVWSTQPPAPTVNTFEGSGRPYDNFTGWELAETTDGRVRLTCVLTVFQLGDALNLLISEEEKADLANVHATLKNSRFFDWGDPASHVISTRTQRSVLWWQPLPDFDPSRRNYARLTRLLQWTY